MIRILIILLLFSFSSQAQFRSVVIPYSATSVDDDVIQRKGGYWMPRSMAELKTDLGIISYDSTSIYLLVNLRVKYTDTSSMFQAYRDAINGKVNISDTAAMLSAYRTLVNAKLNASDTGAMLSAYLSLINARVKYSDTTNILSAYQTALNTRATISYVDAADAILTTGVDAAKTSYSLSVLQALGSSIKAQVVGFDYTQIIGATVLVDGTEYYSAVWLPEADTITGVKFFQTTLGNFIADNFNGIALYTYSGGTLTQVATSANDGNIWKGAANTIQAVPFTSPYVAAAGLYFIGHMYNQSSVTAAPGIGVGTGAATLWLQLADLTNSAKIIGSIATQTSLPATRAMSALGGNAARYWFGLY